MPTPPKRRKAGRPPAGPQGEKTSEFPPVTIRLDPRTKALLAALGQFHGLPAREIVTRGLTLALQDLPVPAVRQVMQWTRTIEQHRPSE